MSETILNLWARGLVREDTRVCSTDPSTYGYGRRNAGVRRVERLSARFPWGILTGCSSRMATVSD